MTYTVLQNKKQTTATLLVTGNTSLTVAGNSSVSDLAVDDEVITNASIQQIQWGCPAGSAIVVRRGDYLIGSYDSSGYIDYSGNALVNNKALDQDFDISVPDGSSCTITIRKRFDPPISQTIWGEDSAEPTSLELLQTYLSGSAKSGIWLPTRLSTCWTDDGSTQATAGQAMYRTDDLSGNGNYLRQTTLNSRPLATEGWTFDNIDDYIGFPFSGGAGAAAMRLVFAIKSTDTMFVVASDTDNSPFAMQASTGSGAASPLAGGTLIADGVSLGATPSRIAVQAALATGDWVMAVLRGADLSTWSGFGFGNLSIPVDGAIGGAVLFNEADISDDAATEALAITLLEEELGL